MLVPRRSSALSVLGTNTLPIYLLHPVALSVLRRFHVDDVISDTPLSLLVMLGLAAVLTLAFGNPLVARLMRPVTEPDLVFSAATLGRLRPRAAAETARR